MKARKFHVFVALMGVFAAVAPAADWKQESSGTTYDFYGVSFPDALNGWAVGEDTQHIHHTADGGNTWTTQVPAYGTVLFAVSFFDALHGMAAGSEGTILYTVDGGAAWQAAQSGWMLSYYGAYQAGPARGYAAGKNTIMQPFVTWTADGWRTLHNANFYFQQGPNNHEGSLTDIRFLDPAHGFATGAVWNGEGALCESTDGGATWSTVAWNTHALRALDFPSALTGYVVGDGGTCLKTTDGGATWVALATGITQDLLDVDFVTDETGIAVGAWGAIISTADGGLHWVAEDGGAPLTNLHGVEYPALDAAFAVGDDGVILARVPPLQADPLEIPASTGGTVDFTLAGRAGNGGRTYLLLGSVSGTTPGTPLPGGGAVLPLQWDAFTLFVVQNLNTPVFANFMGGLDAAGLGTARLNAPGSLDPNLVGITLYFAYLLSAPFDFTSNPVEIAIVP